MRTDLLLREALTSYARRANEIPWNNSLSNTFGALINNQGKRIDPEIEHRRVSHEASDAQYFDGIFSPYNDI